MTIKNILYNFVIGGTLTSLIVVLENSGHRNLSGFVTLVPVFTLVSYFFIGESHGGLAVSEHSKFVLVGTLVSWVPYMLAIAFLAPKLGANKAIGIGLGIFFVFAGAFVGLAGLNKWFQ